jgi:hypothetical protein
MITTHYYIQEVMNIYQIITHDFHDICFQEKSASHTLKPVLSKGQRRRINKRNRKMICE